MKRTHQTILSFFAAAGLWTLPVATAQAPLGKISLQNAALTDVIAQLARQLHINYTLDPAVKSGMILSTYGDTSHLDARTLLDLILRINGAAMVQKGNFYRIIPANDPGMKATHTQENDQPMLNLVVPKYVTVDNLVKILDPGGNATVYTYSPAHLLFILDNRRNMPRIMDSIALLDTDQPTPPLRQNPEGAARPSVISLEPAKKPGESLLGADMGGGFHGCVANDNSPNGTVREGYKKVIAQSPFGPSCHWEKVK